MLGFRAGDRSVDESGKRNEKKKETCGITKVTVVEGYLTFRVHVMLWKSRERLGNRRVYMSW